MRKKLPLVTVVVPSYNHEEFIEETIESIINQTYKNIELIVIDDGSVDNSVDIIKNLSYKYKFIFIHRENKGLAATLNEGIDLSNGKYFSICASDDKFSLNKISQQIKFMEESKNENIAGVFGYVEMIPNIKKKYNKVILKKETYSFLKVSMHKFYLPAPTNFYLKKALIKVNGFDEDTILEDWSIYLKLTYAGYNLVRLPYILTYYRKHDKNISNNISKMDYARKKLIKKYSFLSYYKIILKRMEYVTMIHYLKRLDIRFIIFFIKFLRRLFFR